MASTWVDGSAAAGLGGALALTPAGSAMQAYEDAIHADPATDERLLALCRVRAASLLAAPAVPVTGLDPADVEALPQWPSSSRFSERDRAALAFAEQWLLDPSGMTDELCADLRAALGDDGAVAFTFGLSVVEAMTRVSLVLGTTA